MRTPEYLRGQASRIVRWSISFLLVVANASASKRFALARRLFDRSPDGKRGVLIGDGAFQFRVIGTSYHQQVLERIAGSRTVAGYQRYCAALLLPQPNNLYDRHAIAVRVDDLEVAHLDREHAREFERVLRSSGYADAVCEAEIVGGWVRVRDDWGYVGVRLNAVLPFRLQSTTDWEVSRAAAEMDAQRGPTRDRSSIGDGPCASSRGPLRCYQRPPLGWALRGPTMRQRPNLGGKDRGTYRYTVTFERDAFRSPSARHSYCCLAEMVQAASPTVSAITAPRAPSGLSCSTVESLAV